MKTLTLIQGTPEWHAHRDNPEIFNASDAAAMLNESPYKTRDELIREYATGIKKDIDPATQARFDEGHLFESLARPVAEEIIGEDLFPVTGLNGQFSASFDGLTIEEDVAFEHKRLNNAIRACQTIADLPLYYKIQMEHQLLVSADTKKCLFMASEWEEAPAEEGAEPGSTYGYDEFFDENGVLAEAVRYKLVAEKHFWYKPDLALRERIVRGWAQFVEDVKNYKHVDVVPAAVAAPIRDLPAITYQLNGLALTSNLPIYKKAALELVEDSKKPMVTDQDFVDRDALCKKFKKSEESIKLMKQQVIGEIKDVAAFTADLDEIGELIRQARINGERQIEAEKLNRKNAIINAAKTEQGKRLAALNERLGSNLMPVVAADYAAKIKGLSKLESIQNAVSSELARWTTEATAIAERIEANRKSLTGEAHDWMFLFPDFATVCAKASDDFAALLAARCAKHAADLEAERERIRKEEQERADREAKERADKEAKATAATAAATAAPANAPTLSEVLHAVAPAEIAQAFYPDATPSVAPAAHNQGSTVVNITRQPETPVEDASSANVAHELASLIATLDADETKQVLHYVERLIQHRTVAAAAA